MSSQISRRSFLAATATAAAASSLRPGPAAAAPALLQTRMVDNTDLAIVFTPAAKWQSWANLGAGWYGGTSRSTNTIGATFEYANPSCTRLQWWSTTKNDRGTADVFVDGVFVSTVSTYNATLTPTKVVFDSGPLPSGAHAIKVVVKAGPWTECDAIEVAEAVHETFVVDDADPAISYVGGWGAYTGVAGHLAATAHSTATKDASFYYGLENCSRIVWVATKEAVRGTADVLIDGVFAATVDLYNPTQVHQQTVFDSGVMTSGSHSIMVVCRGARGAAPAGSPWISLDALRVTGDPASTGLVDGSHPTFVRAYGARWDAASSTSTAAWTVSATPTATFGRTLSSATQGSFAEMTFTGTTVEWIGTRGPDRGTAEVYLDGELATTVDCYDAVVRPRSVLFRRDGLASGPFHTVRVRVLGQKIAASSGVTIDVDSFRAAGAIDVLATLAKQRAAEITTIRARTKPYLAPAVWRPVAAATRVPDTGVSLTSGPLRTCFDNNVHYVLHCASLPNNVELVSGWVKDWPGSNEGRMLMGAGHALRWADMLSTADRASLQAVVDTIVANAKARQDGRTQPTAHAGFALPWAYAPNEPIAPPAQPAADAQIDAYMITYPGHERANYDRAMWTRGMVAAIQAGTNADASVVLRRMADWFNTWYAARPTPAPALVTYSLGAQGHIASTLVHASPIGVDADLVTAERYYVQDWWLTQLANREPLSFSHHPNNRPHSYLLVGLESYLDHYNATGAQKYLSAALGGWEMFRRDFVLIGGGTTILEAAVPYPAQGFDIIRKNNEFDGSIFWIYLTQRLQQLFPDEERFTAEIERHIYNVGLAQQSATGHHGIRYHAYTQKAKEAPDIKNTCCEVNGAGLYSRLPEFVYSVADDGLSVHLFAGSAITARVDGVDVTLTTTTEFPLDVAVTHTVAVATPVAMKLRVRVPSWSATPMDVRVNGVVAVTGVPGSYAVVDRTWSDGDVVDYTLGAVTTLTRYRGVAEVNGYQRYALMYGPVMMSYLDDASVGERQSDGTIVPRVAITPAQLLGALQRVSGELAFTVGGDAGKVYRPYYAVQTESFNNFPIIQP